METHIPMALQAQLCILVADRDQLPLSALAVTRVQSRLNVSQFIFYAVRSASSWLASFQGRTSPHTILTTCTLGTQIVASAGQQDADPGGTSSTTSAPQKFGQSFLRGSDVEFCLVQSDGTALSATAHVSSCDASMCSTSNS